MVGSNQLSKSFYNFFLPIHSTLRTFLCDPFDRRSFAVQLPVVFGLVAVDEAQVPPLFARVEHCHSRLDLSLGASRSSRRCSVTWHHVIWRKMMIAVRVLQEKPLGSSFWGLFCLGAKAVPTCSWYYTMFPSFLWFCQCAIWRNISLVHEESFFPLYSSNSDHVLL